MDFDDMKKDKDFQKWCFDTDLVGNKNWFNLENGSGDEVYIAYEAWEAGQQSKQAEVDELRERIDEINKLVDLWREDYITLVKYDDGNRYCLEDCINRVFSILKGDQS